MGVKKTITNKVKRVTNMEAWKRMEDRRYC